MFSNLRDVARRVSSRPAQTRTGIETSAQPSLPPSRAADLPRRRAAGHRDLAPLDGPRNFLRGNRPGGRGCGEGSTGLDVHGSRTVAGLGGSFVRSGVPRDAPNAFKKPQERPGMQEWVCLIRGARVVCVVSVGRVCEVGYLPRIARALQLDTGSGRCVRTGGLLRRQTNWRASLHDDTHTHSRRVPGWDCSRCVGETDTERSPSSAGGSLEARMCVLRNCRE